MVGQSPCARKVKTYSSCCCKYFGFPQYLAFRLICDLLAATYPACLKAACLSASDSLKCRVTSAGMNGNGVLANSVNPNTARVIWLFDRI